MNIFVLDLDPKICASYHCDKHVVKMIVETAQLLSTAQHENGINLNIGERAYKRTHKNHPCAIWARESITNYRWLCYLGIELCKEYTKRYGKIHKTQSLIELLNKYRPLTFSMVIGTKRPQSMPEQYRNEDVVKAYRDYYLGEKQSILKYTNTEIPEFICHST